MTDKRLVAVAMVALCLFAYVFSLYQLSSASSDLGQELFPGDTPVLVLSPAGDPIGTVVVAHGFAANIGVMRAMGADLARNGYRAVLFDFPGHGNSRLPANDTSLFDTLDQVCARYGGDSYSLAGHSMGSLAVLMYGGAGHGRAVIGLSSFYSNVSSELPRDMLLIAGNTDLPNVVSSLPAAVANGTGVTAPEPGITYGNFSEATARKYVYVEGNHLTVLYNTMAYDEMILWLDATYRHARAPGGIRHDLPFAWAFTSIGAALLGFLPGLYLLSVYIRDEHGRLRPYLSHPIAKPLLTIVVGSTAAAIIVNLFNPVAYTRLMMADRVVGFLLYAGIFTIVVYYLLRDIDPQVYMPGRVLKPLLVSIAAGIVLIAAIALPAGLSFYEQPTVPGRLALMAAAGLLTLPFFMANDLLSRRSEGLRSLAMGLACRVIALAFLALSFAAATGGFFNIVILPILAPLFIALELVSYCAYRWSGSFYLGAFLNALVTGWLLASAFPIGIATMHW